MTKGKIHNNASFLIIRKTNIDISVLEEKYRLQLPPIYKSFIQCFEDVLGSAYKDKEGELHTLSYFKYYAKKLDYEDLMFTGFMDVKEVFKNHKNTDTWVKNGLIPISEHDHGGVILVGIKENNLDKLFFEYSNGIQYIEKDIYSFVTNLTYPSDELHLNFF